MGERTLTHVHPGAELATRSRAVQATPRHDAPSRTRRRDPDQPHATLRTLAAARIIQPRLVVGAADDPFEREAERTAAGVTSGDRMPAQSMFDGAPLAGRLMRLAQRAIGKTEPPTKKDDDEKRARKAPSGPGGPEVAPRGIEAGVRAMSTGGSPLPASVRSMLEPRFGFDFSDVRVHVGRDAAGAAHGLGARAFTVGDHIFFGEGQYQPTSRSGQHLIAHELTHTIQQKPGAARAARLLAAPPRAQRFLEDVRNAIADKIRNWVTKDFPPWDLITLIIGWDPFRNVAVKGSTKDWIRAAMKLAPDGEALYAKLDGEGKVDAIAAWWDAEVAKLDLSYEKIVALVKEGWERLSAGDIFDPFGAWNTKIKPLIAPVVQRVWNFIRAVGAKVYQVVKDLVLTAVGNWAKEQKGYPLLTMVLGRDPVTGEEVKPTLKGVIYAVLDLVPGGDKIKENLEKAKTVEKAAAWFKTEVGKLQLTWAGIKALFSQAWDAFKVVDLLSPVRLFEKMWTIFGPPRHPHHRVPDRGRQEDPRVHLRGGDADRRADRPPDRGHRPQDRRHVQPDRVRPGRLHRPPRRRPHQGRPPVRRQHLGAPEDRPHRVARRDARRCRPRPAQGLGPQGHPRPRAPDPGHHVGQGAGQARRGRRREDRRDARDGVRVHQDPGHRRAGRGMEGDRRRDREPVGHGHRRHQGLGDHEDRHGRDHQARDDVQPGRRGDPGDHRHLQHDRLLHRADQADPGLRRGRRRLHRQHRPGQDRGRRELRREGDGEDDPRAPGVPRPPDRPGRRERRHQEGHHRDPGEGRQGDRLGHQVGRRQGEVHCSARRTLPRPQALPSRARSPTFRSTARSRTRCPSRRWAAPWSS